MRRRILSSLRARLGCPRLPGNFVGEGLMPWLSGPNLHTRFLLNGTLDPVLRRECRRLDITRYGEDGTILEEHAVSLGNDRITILDLPPGRNGRIEAGFCLLRLENGKGIYHQHHLQLIGPGTFGTTHGRPKGVFVFGRQRLAEPFIAMLDPRPYQWFSSVLPSTQARQYVLLMNIADRGCRLEARGAGADDVVHLAPYGSRLLPLKPGPASSRIVAFHASAPFTFYVVMSRPDETGWTMQHIKQEF